MSWKLFKEVDHTLARGLHGPGDCKDVYITLRHSQDFADASVHNYHDFRLPVSEPWESFSLQSVYLFNTIHVGAHSVARK